MCYQKYVSVVLISGFVEMDRALLYVPRIN